MKITTIGIDLAKNVFQVHGVDERGNPLIQKKLKRSLRRHKNVVAIARANKNARVAWALLAHGRDYNVEYERSA